MILAIDGYEANVARRVGIGQYAYEMLTHLYSAIGKAPQRQLSVRVYLPSVPLPDMPPQNTWWKYRVVGPRAFWTFIALPFFLSLDRPKAAVVFSPTHYIPRFIALPRIMAIMDLSYLVYPQLFKDKDLHQLVYWTEYSARHAEAIFTISSFSKRAIIEAYKISGERVIVTYPGIAERHRHPMTKDKLALKYGISQNYILSVGTIQPRKNYSRLIAAFALFLKKNPSKPEDTQLIIVGKKGWLYEEILKAPAVYKIADRVRFLDFVPDSDLPNLYRHALCFALPSLYEGFGLPVLEAMAYGCPVVVSRVSSLPEIAGSAGIYVEPENVASIAGGLLTAVTERTLESGKARVKQGIEQSKKFTWDSAAAVALATIEKIGRSK